MIYFDHASTTPLDSGVLDKMLPYFKEVYGNAASQHSAGRNAAAALLTARDGVAEILGCLPEEVYFTSGGTETGNWAAKGAAIASGGRGGRVVISAIEHPALLESVKDLTALGFKTTLVYPDKSGKVNPADFEKAITDDTVFCALMHANNETGVIQPVEEVGAICKEKGVFYYVDCVQTAGVLELPVKYCDMLGISAHKFYGPKGSGAAYINKKAKITRLISGGKQESGLRAGTSDVAGAVGLYEALRLACENREKNNAYVAGLRDKFLTEVLNGIEGTALNGALNRLPSNANISFSGCEGENILFLLDMAGVCASTGSACSAGAVTVSHVLKAMGIEERTAKSSVRFSLGKNNTLQEVSFAVNVLKDIVKKVRKS